MNECMYEGQKKNSKFLVTFRESSIQLDYSASYSD